MCLEATIWIIPFYKDRLEKRWQVTWKRARLRAGRPEGIGPDEKRTQPELKPRC